MEFDVVVVGAGHNSLTCAAYLADAGLSVVVIEASGSIGGGTRTEELTLPGWRHDPCSSEHVLLQSNPLVADDELGLIAVEGLRYLAPDPAIAFPVADGDALVVRPDLGATAAEFARFSPADAEALVTMAQEWETLEGSHARHLAGLPPLGDAASDRYRALRERSARSVIDERFAHPATQSAVSWLSFMTALPQARPGTGALPEASLVALLRHSRATPVGGSGALATALAGALTRRGGSVVTGATVRRYLTESGRCRGVVSDVGEFRARRAVVTGAHLATLPVAVEGVSPALEEAADRWRAGLAVFAVHLALRQPPRCSTRDGEITPIAIGLGGPAGLDRQVASALDGEVDAHDPWIALVTPGAVDATRAPGAAVTLLSVAPALRRGRPWTTSDADAYADHLVSVARPRVSGLGDADVLARRVESPTTLAARSPSNLAGSCHGGEFLLRDGSVISGWPGYRTDVAGLYLTGSTSHPGGSVSGRPGRNAAREVLSDLGFDVSRFTARP